MGPVKNSKVGPLAPRLLLRVTDQADEFRTFRLFLSENNHVDRWANRLRSLCDRFFVARRLQRRAPVGDCAIGVRGEYGGILIDQSKCAAQNRRGRTPGLLEHSQLEIREAAMKQFERGTRRPSKPVDRLIRIADCKDVPFRARDPGQNLNLSEVGVLKFVSQNEARL